MRLSRRASRGVADPAAGDRDERIALLLTARLLESGVVVEDPDLGDDGGHVNLALVLAERLRRVAGDPDEAAPDRRGPARRRREPAEV